LVVAFGILFTGVVSAESGPSPFSSFGNRGPGNMGNPEMKLKFMTPEERAKFEAKKLELREDHRDDLEAWKEQKGELRSDWKTEMEKKREDMKDLKKEMKGDIRAMVAMRFIARGENLKQILVRINSRIE